MYTISRSGLYYCLISPGGETIRCYESRQEAEHAATLLNRIIAEERA